MASGIGRRRMLTTILMPVVGTETAADTGHEGEVA